MFRRARSADKTVRDIRRAARRSYSAEVKISIVIDDMKSSDSVAVEFLCSQCLVMARGCLWITRYLNNVAGVICIDLDGSLELPRTKNNFIVIDCKDATAHLSSHFIGVFVYFDDNARKNFLVHDDAYIVGLVKRLYYFIQLFI